MATNSEADIGASDDGPGEDAPSVESADAERIEAEKRVPDRGRVGRWPANDYY